MEIPKERKCTKCEKVKPLTDEYFYPQAGYKYGLTRWCRDCRTKYSVELNKEKRDEYRANWERNARGNDIDFYRAREFAREMKSYGTTIGWYSEKLIKQKGTCALCKHFSYVQRKMQRLQVDHDHACCDLKTKSCGECLRGLLCADCNVQVSYIERTLTMGTIVPIPGTWLAAAIQYLDSYAVQFNFGYNALTV